MKLPVIRNKIKKSVYPVDGLKQFDVHGVAGELALDLDEAVARGHGLYQHAVRRQNLGQVRDIIK